MPSHHHMRRADKAITNHEDIIAVLSRGTVCHLGLHDDPYPYVVPLSYGYAMKDDETTLFFHSAGRGKKIDLIRRDPRAFFVVDTDHAIVTGEEACRWSMKYASVMGAGEIAFVTEAEEKRIALEHIMGHYSHTGGWEFPDAALAGVTVLSLSVSEMTGKRSPNKD